MRIESRHVGTKLKERIVGIEWRDTMNFAAAVGDDNPAYFDDEQKSGVVAPPMTAVAVTWPILERIWENIESDDFPTEVLMTQVHYTEHLRLHRLMKPGDRLTISGKVAAIVPHRAGTHCVIRLDAVDAKREAVFTEHIGALLRGVDCEGGARGDDELPDMPAAAASAGCVWKSKIHIDPLMPFVYDGCTRIFFPIHTSKRFARSVGLPGIILQGTATLALAIREIVDREAGGDPAKIKEIGCRFTGMVLPNSSIYIILEQHAPDGCLHFHVESKNGNKAISGGFALIE